MQAGTGLVRVLRALLLSGVVAGLALSGHSAAGGVASAVGLGLLTMAALPVAWLLGRRQVGRAAALAFLGAAQLVGHALLVALAPAPSPAASGMAGCEGMTVTTLPHAAGPTILHVTPGMVLTHSVATLVTALLLAHGERALWDVVARLLPRFGRLWAPQLGISAPLGVTPTRWVPMPPYAVVPGRGPPARLA